MLKSTNVELSRYIYGGRVEDRQTRLGWWERKEFQKSVTDVTLTLEHQFHMRPDLLAYELYGKSSLMWFIMQYNNILDVTEFVEGLELTLPTKYRLFQELLTTRA